MIGGLFSKSTSILTLCAAAGFVIVGAGVTPAKAADLGGDCCADLEERVANLEATTVRKGNKLVSLTLSGHVNRGLMWYDDGSMTGMRSFDNIMSHSRFRMLGSAKVAPGWSVGFYQEFEISTASNSAVSQLDDRGFNSAGGNLQGSSPFNFAIRQSHWYMKNDSLGTLSVGRLNMATKDMPGIELGNIAIVAASDMMLNMLNFNLRPTGGSGREGLAGVKLGAFRTQSSADNLRTDGVRYDSPTLMGFTLSAAAGDDYIWDVALRYAGDWNGFRIAAGVGYYVDMDEQCVRANAAAAGVGCEVPTVAKTFRKEEAVFKSNASVWHQPTGLFVSGAYWNLQYDGTGGAGSANNVVAGFGGGNRPDSNMYWVAAGLRKNWFGIGDTSVFGEYGRINDAITGTAFNTTTGQAGVGTNFGGVTDSTMTRWGVGLTQNLDKAATTLYLNYQNFNPEVSGCVVAAANCVVVKQKFDDIQAIQAGAIVRF